MNFSLVVMTAGILLFALMAQLFIEFDSLAAELAQSQLHPLTAPLKDVPTLQ